MASSPSSARAFVRLEAPRRLPLEGHDQYWFDPAHQHFLLLKDRMFRTLSLLAPPATDPGDPPPRPPTTPSPPLHYDASEQGDCLLARLSLDSTLLAIQRSRHVVEVVDVQHSREWAIDTKGGGSVTWGDRGQSKPSSPKRRDSKGVEGHGREEGEEGGGATGGLEDPCSILPGGVIWSDHGGNSQDLVIITERGVDMYKVAIKRSQCKLSRALPHAGTRHFWYNAEQRFLLLSTGPGGWGLRGYFLRFEVSAALPKLELPPPEKLPKFELPPSSPQSSSLNPHDLQLARLYGHMYAAHIDTKAATLRLYRLGKDQVKALPCALNFYVQGGPVRLHAVDNCLLLHCMGEARLTFVYDVHAFGGPEEEGESLLPPRDPFCGGGPVAYAAVVGGDEEGGAAVTPVEAFYNPRAFELLAPDWAWDLGQWRLWALRLNLPAIAESHTAVPKIFPFLSRRGQSLAPRLPGFPRPSPHDEDIGPTAHRVILQQIKARLLEEIPLFPSSTDPTDNDGESDGHNVQTMLRICLALPPPTAAQLLRAPLTAEEREEAMLAQRRRKRAALEGPVVVTQEELLREVLDPLASIALLQEKDLPSPPYLAAALLHTITTLQAAFLAHAAACEQAEAEAAAASSYLGRRRWAPGRRQKGEEGEERVDPRIVVLAVRLWLSLGRLDSLVRFLGAQQGALDSEALALFLLHEVPAAAPSPSISPPEGIEEEEEERTEREFRQLLRDMLGRLQRLDLLVLQLLREGRFAEAIRTMRGMIRQNRQQAPPGAPVDTSISGSALLLRSFTDAALARVHALTADEQEVGKDPTPSSSHRAAIAYLLHEWLRSLEHTLFPPPLSAAAASKEADGSGEPKKRFTDLVPQFPFEGLFPPSVANTLAHQIYGYERKPRQAPAVPQEALADRRES